MIWSRHWFGFLFWVDRCFGARCAQYAGARAGIIDDYVERSQRPEMTSEQALIKLLDARGILYELRVPS